MKDSPSRHLAIGDIHGCYRALKALCDFVELRESDTLITLGDYPDRGPHTEAVFSLLLELQRNYNLRPLRGNHDIMMLAARDNEDDFKTWMEVGGDKTLESYACFIGQPGFLASIPEIHWHFLEHDLLPYFEADSHFFVHANAYPDVSLAEQPDYILYWEQYDNPARHQSGKIMVCGHTSQKSGLPIANANAVCIDTWAYGDGWLTCLHVESGMIWQTNERGDKRKMWLDEIR